LATPPIQCVRGMRPRHPAKEIEEAVREAEAKGWTVSLSHGHAWGILRCRLAARGGCQISVWSTPRDADNHARQLRRQIARCPH
jgi:hypothetical protein